MFLKIVQQISLQISHKVVVGILRPSQTYLNLVFMIPEG